MNGHAKELSNLPNKNANSDKRQRIESETDLKILTIDSRHDRATQACCDYRNKHVYPYLESKEFELVRCQGRSARRVYVQSEACRDDIVYITGAGHGLYTTYMGQHFDPIFDIGNYQPQEPDGKVVHFFACQTAAELGPDFVNNGCLAYFGYDVDVIVPMHISDAFFDCDSEIDRAFADGLRAEEVYDRVIAHYNQKIRELEDGGHDGAAAALGYYRDHLCAPSVDAKWGDKKAKIV